MRAGRIDESQAGCRKTSKVAGGRAAGAVQCSSSSNNKKTRVPQGHTPS